jgi:hypothetical protein
MGDNKKIHDLINYTKKRVRQEIREGGDQIT